jgi:hypothetical protein
VYGLTSTAAEIIELSHIPGHAAPGVYPVGLPAKRITLADQQHRAINLVWALLAENRLASGDTLAIVGARVAGRLRLAVRTIRAPLRGQQGPVRNSKDRAAGSIRTSTTGRTAESRGVGVTGSLGETVRRSRAGRSWVPRTNVALRSGRYPMPERTWVRRVSAERHRLSNRVSAPSRNS